MATGSCCGTDGLFVLQDTGTAMCHCVDTAAYSGNMDTISTSNNVFLSIYAGRGTIGRKTRVVLIGFSDRPQNGCDSRPRLSKFAFSLAKFVGNVYLV